MCRLYSTSGKVISCKAAVAWGPKQPFVIEEIQVQPPHAGEIRIQITHTSLCHTDYTYWEAKDQSKIFPRIFGHEAAGIVESIGEDVINIQPGDHVIPVFTGECTECKFCRSSKTNLCNKYVVDPNRGVMLGDQTSRFSVHGKPIFHFLGTSTFSEFTVVDQGQVVKIDQSAPPDIICLLGCGVATGVGAVWNTAHVEGGSTVAVFGLGCVGLAVVLGARIAGASRIIGVDVNPEKFVAGKAFGVTDFLNPKDYERHISKVIQEMTDGGVDYSFECIGNTEVMRAAYDSCQQGWGKSVVVGVDGSSKMIELNPLELFSGRIWTGSVFGGFKCKTQLPQLVDKYLRKELPFEDMITHQLPLSKINEAFNLFQEGKSVRCVLKMGS